MNLVGSFDPNDLVDPVDPVDPVDSLNPVDLEDFVDFVDKVLVTQILNKALAQIDTVYVGDSSTAVTRKKRHFY